MSRSSSCSSEVDSASSPPPSRPHNMILLTGYSRPQLPTLNRTTELEKREINEAVSKVLQGYDWTLVPMANK